MAYLKLRNTITLLDGDPSVMYEQSANQAIQVWLEEGGEEAFTAVPALGKYAAASWEIFGPDGPEIVLSGADGTIADPKSFTPNVPGRWLVRLTATKYVLNDDMDVVLSDNSESFTALYEVQDPNIIGHRNARPYGNGSVTRGTSVIAPNETSEFDNDEGWSRGIERYLTTVSREQGFRSTVVVLNDSGVQIDAGKVCVVPDTDALSKWENADSGLEDFQNTIIRVLLADISSLSLSTKPMFLALEDIPSGERGVALVEGVVPFSTAGMAGGDRIFISSTSELTKDQPSLIDPTDFDILVGAVTKGGEDDDTSSPGGVYFHGHTGILPGLVTGPLSSTDDAIATWDGTGGNKLQNSEIRVTSDGVQATLIGPDDKPTNISSDGSQSINLVSANSGVADTGNVTVSSGNSGAASGNTVITTGDGDSTGSVVITTGGGVSPGSVTIVPAGTTQPAAVSSNVTIRGGDAADTGNASGAVTLQSGTGTGSSGSGNVVISTGQTHDAATTPGDVHITGGVNLVTGAYGKIVLQHGSGDVHVKSPITDFFSPLVRFYAIDNSGGGGPDIEKVRVGHEYGVSSKLQLMDELGAASISLDSDDRSWFLNALAVGDSAAPDAGFSFQVYGNGKFENLTVVDKLDVGGLIDPTGLILTPISSLAEITDSIGAGEGGIFVAGPDMAPEFTPGGIYYAGGDGTTSSLTDAVAPGDVMGGPFAADSTVENQVAVWVTTGGDELRGGNLIVSPTGLVTTTLSDVGIASDLTIKPNDHTGAGDQNAATLELQAGQPLGGGDGGEINITASNGSNFPGHVRVRAGSVTDSGSGGTLSLNAGDGSLDEALAGVGGNLTATAGSAADGGGMIAVFGGDSLNSSGHPSDGLGGEVIIRTGFGGEGLSSGHLNLEGGPGAKGSFADGYKGGHGGSVTIHGGDGGKDAPGAGGDIYIHSGDATALDPALWGVADAGLPGKVQLRSGKSADTVVGHAHFKPGANIDILAGDAGLNSAGDGGNIVLEPGALDPNHPMPWMAHNGIVHMCGAIDAMGDQKSFVAIGSQLASGHPTAIGDCFGQKAHTLHGLLKIVGAFDPTCIYVDPQTVNPVIGLLTDAYTTWADTYTVERVAQMEAALTAMEAKETALGDALSSAQATLATWEEDNPDDVNPPLEDYIRTLEREVEEAGRIVSKLTAEKIKFETPPVDPASPEGRKFIDNTLWWKLVESPEGEYVESRMMIGEEPVGTRGTIQYDNVPAVYDDAIAISDGPLLAGDGPTGRVMYYNVPSTIGVVLVDSTEGDVAVMLPAPSDLTGRSIIVKDKVGMSNIPGKGQIHIVPPSGHTLDQYTHSTDGDAVGPYPVQTWASVECYSDGNNWFII